MMQSQSMNSVQQLPKQWILPKIWRQKEILTFLDIFESTFHASVIDPFDSEPAMWDSISEKLLAEGYTASAEQCQRKWNFLYKTHVKNQNQHGAFYAKIKQIVDFSHNVSTKKEAKEIPSGNVTLNTYEVLENDEHADADTLQAEETVENVVIEALEEEEQVDIPEGISIKTEIQTSTQSEEDTSEELCDQLPAKRIKLQCEEPEPDTADNDALERTEEPPQILAVDLNSVLLSLVNKIDAIHEEQLSQGRRLEWMERLQLENRQTLLEIKNHLKIK